LKYSDANRNQNHGVMQLLWRCRAGWVRKLYGHVQRRAGA
jgi:hypothetical protein